MIDHSFVQKYVGMAYHIGHLLQIILPSPGCRKTPKCSICNYGSDIACNEETVKMIVETVLNTYLADDSTVTTVLLNTYGSILDENEFPVNNLTAALAVLSNYNCEQYTITRQYPIQRVILETHYTTINSTLLQSLDVTGAYLCIEMGYESSNELAQEYLHKPINDNDFIDTLQIIADAHMISIVNVLLGAPGLVTPAEQIRDCRRTIETLFNYGAHDIVIFPVNVKPNTELYSRYIKGLYQRPTYYQLIDVLMTIPKDNLRRISVSWYGDRQYYRRPSFEYYGLAPDCDPGHLKSFIEGITAFNNCSDNDARYEIIKNLAQLGYAIKRKEKEIYHV